MEASRPPQLGFAIYNRLHLREFLVAFVAEFGVAFGGLEQLFGLLGDPEGEPNTLLSKLNAVRKVFSLPSPQEHSSAPRCGWANCAVGLEKAFIFPSSTCEMHRRLCRRFSPALATAEDGPIGYPFFCHSL